MRIERYGFRATLAACPAIRAMTQKRRVRTQRFAGEPVSVLPESAVGAINWFSAPAECQTRPWASEEPALPEEEQEPPSDGRQPGGEGQLIRLEPDQERRTTGPVHSTTGLARSRMGPERSTTGPAERRPGPEHRIHNSGPERHSRSHRIDGGGGDSRTRSRSRIRTRDGGGRRRCRCRQP